MAIDILFLIMTGFGFFFGFAYGPIRVLVVLLSFGTAIAAAMRFTPLTTQLIQETFEVDSPFLPFLSFLLTLLLVLFIARLLNRLFEENINGDRFNRLSQFLGGVMMSLAFTFLFSVLVQFFSAADVIKPEKAKQTSFFYGYIEQIPARGAVVISTVAPFVQRFALYMQLALERLEQRERKPKRSHMMETETQSTEELPEIEIQAEEPADSSQSH